MYTRHDDFTGKLPVPSIGNGKAPEGVYPTGQPMLFKKQMYPKIPYYSDSLRHQGLICKDQESCGVLGHCENGVCKVKKQGDTVFDIKL